ncbi:glycoside hydrolase family 43 protein [Microbacterium sp. JZ31]|uniref:glycoside hydrolase family 43 protein n=1 Tax=Microbacterium sp. JZ31 TaxID=1906274 RepID=UPI001933DC58|nr:glycoside hydrolase family 43 protein [Microbacterium sp. JZ31]
MTTAEFAPVVPGFHPDPSVCRVGDDYYLAHSTFEYVPGVPIRHSRDLVTWTLVGHVLTRDAQFPAARSRASGGIYAPTLRHHDGRFWLIVTDVGDGGGQRLFHAPAAEGPWSDAIVLRGLDGIDPDLAWTEDGTCLVSYCSWADGGSAIWQAAIDPLAGLVLDEPRVIWRGSPDMGHTEGPHLYRRGDWWYLVTAEGGTERGHGISAVRSRDPRGPFEAPPSNPIYTHRSTEHPVQNVGHADLVERVDGSWAAVHLGVRTAGYTPSFHVNGRETFLAEVDWRDDWPVIRPSDAEVPPVTGFVDRFDALGPRWVSPGAWPERFARAGADGLEVEAAEGSGVYARVEALSWEARVEIETPDAVAHVEVRLDDRHRVGVRRDGSRATATWTVGGVDVVLGEADDPDGIVWIDSVPSETAGPDDLVLAVGADRRALGRIDGRYLSTEVATGFTGRVLGIRVERGAARVREVRFAPR